MIINRHKLIHAPGAGNGYHDYCKYCNKPLVIDLGYCSLDNTKCIDREIIEYTDIPDIIKNFANFNGLIWDKPCRKFVKSYTNSKYSLNDLDIIIKTL